MKKLIYFHGLGSDKNSRKFGLLKDYLDNRYELLCVEWHISTDFRILIFNVFKRLLREPEVVLIGDSIGGNYACQMRDLLIRNNVKTTLVLFNPLLSIDSLIASFPFPKVLLASLHDIRQLEDCLSIISINDGVIDHASVTYGQGTNRLFVDDVHELLHFERYLQYIDRYISTHSLLQDKIRQYITNSGEK